MSATGLHTEIEQAIIRHQEFFEGRRTYLIKFEVKGYENRSFGVAIPSDWNTGASLQGAESGRESLLEYEPPYNGLDWDRQFEKYYKSRVRNARIIAEKRLELGLQDDYIPTWYPYFGIAIHHAFFDGKVEFHGDTSYCHPVLEEACEYGKLHFDPDNVWIRRLKEAMLYCRDEGQGVLLASLRGGNGPMDMANGVMGDNLFTELIEDEDNMHHVMQICTDACDAMYSIQQECASRCMGGTVAAQGSLWMPAPMFGHISSDAGHMIGPRLYEEFEKPYLERLSEKYKGFLLHTHMMGWQMTDTFSDTKGIRFIRPVNDPNQPEISDKMNELFEKSGNAVLMLTLKKDELKAALPKLKGKRFILELQAEDIEDAKIQMDWVKNTVL